MTYKFTFGNGTIKEFANKDDAYLAAKWRDGVRSYTRTPCDKHNWVKGEGELFGGPYRKCTGCGRIKR